MNKLKPYIVRKIVMATCAEEAFNKEKLSKIDSIFIDQDWLDKHKDDTIISTI